MRASERYLSGGPGVTTRHQFSAGAHYDPDNVAFGPIVAVDEHAVTPGNGFDWHAHRGVHIVSCVLDGTLRHEDSNGGERIIGPGALLVQSTGDGIRHRETNASDVDPLRFVQITVVGAVSSELRLAGSVATVGDVSVAVIRGTYVAGGSVRQIVTVLDGTYDNGVGVVGHHEAGDSVRIAGDGPDLTFEGNGTLLVLTLVG